MKYKNYVFDMGSVLVSFRWRDMMMDYGLSAQEADAFYDMML